MLQIQDEIIVVERWKCASGFAWNAKDDGETRR